MHLEDWVDVERNRQSYFQIEVGRGGRGGAMLLRATLPCGYGATQLRATRYSAWVGRWPRTWDLGPRIWRCRLQ
eukprot:4152058-Pyramimonas_sp.AAC.1